MQVNLQISHFSSRLFVCEKGMNNIICTYVCKYVCMYVRVYVGFNDFFFCILQPRMQLKKKHEAPLCCRFVIYC